MTRPANTGEPVTKDFDKTVFGRKRTAPEIAQVEAYWEALRGGRLVPDRSEVDPRGVDSALRNAFILERIAPGLARLRIAGQNLNALMGMEVRGMPFSAMIEPESRSDFAERLEAVFSEPAILRMDLESASGFGRGLLRAELIVLPLKSDFGDISRAIGCLVAHGPIGRAPRRFNLTSHRIKGLIGYGTGLAPVPDTREHAFGEAPAAPYASSKPVPDAPREGGHLRLIVDNG